MSTAHQDTRTLSPAARAKRAKYAYLRKPLATPAEAAERRAYLISIGTIVPAPTEDEPTR